MRRSGRCLSQENVFDGLPISIGEAVCCGGVSRRADDHQENHNDKRDVTILHTHAHLSLTQPAQELSRRFSNLFAYELQTH
jgi:hypothetical protein